MRLADARNEVRRRARALGIPTRLLPTFGQSDQTGRPHVEADAGGYHYVVCERGQEIDRQVFMDLGDLLYRIFSDIAFDWAVAYELEHRIEGRDCRRLIFERHVELLAGFSSDWAVRAARDHEETLRAHPFDDHASVRAVLTKELRDQGQSDDAAWRLACERYPLP